MLGIGGPFFMVFFYGKGLPARTTMRRHVTFQTSTIRLMMMNIFDGNDDDGDESFCGMFD